MRESRNNVVFPGSPFAGRSLPPEREVASVRAGGRFRQSGRSLPSEREVASVRAGGRFRQSGRSLPSERERRCFLHSRENGNEGRRSAQGASMKTAGGVI